MGAYLNGRAGDPDLSQRIVGFDRCRDDLRKGHRRPVLMQQDVMGMAKGPDTAQELLHRLRLAERAAASVKQ